MPLMYSQTISNHPTANCCRSLSITNQQVIYMFINLLSPLERNDCLHGCWIMHLGFSNWMFQWSSGIPLLETRLKRVLGVQLEGEGTSTTGKKTPKFSTSRLPSQRDLDHVTMLFHSCFNANTTQGAPDTIEMCLVGHAASSSPLSSSKCNSLCAE